LDTISQGNMYAIGHQWFGNALLGSLDSPAWE